jgi:hypothetical protein
MKVINAVKAVVVVLLVFILSGCDQIMAAPRNELIGDDELLPTVAGIIDGQKHVIAEYVGEDFGEKALGDFDGETVVNGALDESNGRKYLEFCYVVQQGMTEEDALSVIERARDLISAEEMAVLEAKLDENRTMMMDAAEDVAKGLRPSQRAAFWKDMQKLVVKSTVLLTAGIVYALVPYTVWWGKIAAAAAVSVAAGVVASTLMSLIRYYKYGGDKGESFSEWLTSVTTEPKTAYAMATSVISIGTAAKRSPVVTGIIICVFGLYQIIDDVKPLLTKYDFGF